MKYAVVGAGSMGRRRIRCLLANKVDPADIRLVEVREDRRQDALKLHGVQSLSSLDEAFAWGADAVMICVPGAWHMESALACAQAGRHFFCEVPLSLTTKDTQRLADLAAEKRIVAASGVQPPFHPLFRQFKQWIGEPSFGKPLVLMTDFGSYLPNWHPYEDYRTFYAADQKMGGGNIDVIAQELATIYWLFNDRINQVYVRGSHLTTLEIKANDCWQIVGSTDKEMAINMHFDLIQRAAKNFIKVISETATAELDLTTGTIRRFLVDTQQWETRTVPAGYVYEQCYIDEIALFMQCIEGKANWHNPLPVAIDIVRFLEAMQQSTEQGKAIAIPG